MTDPILGALNGALLGAHRLLGREGLRQYLTLSLEGLDVLDEQLHGPYGATVRDELKRQLALLHKLDDIIRTRQAYHR